MLFCHKLLVSDFCTEKSDLWLVLWLKTEKDIKNDSVVCSGNCGMVIWKENEAVVFLLCLCFS